MLSEKHGIGFRFHNVGVKIMENAQSGQCPNAPQGQWVRVGFEELFPAEAKIEQLQGPVHDYDIDSAFSQRLGPLGLSPAALR
jgi:hypothetical protein